MATRAFASCTPLLPCPMSHRRWGAACFHVACEWAHPERAPADGATAADATPPRAALAGMRPSKRFAVDAADLGGATQTANA